MRMTAVSLWQYSRMEKLDYEKIITEIENKRRFGNLKGVEISGIMLEKLGNPQKDFRVIHVAGTNGKGSVSAFLRSILECAGLKTGLFTSPHLVRFTERIQAGGKEISKEDAARLGQILLSMDFGVCPTMFDYTLAMAMLYFKEQKCDVVILETGLGGKYDSTNACGVPDVAVITKIGFDHMHILGNTLKEIAAEKAGIIKHGSAVVLQSQEKEVMDVLLAAAQKEQIQELKITEWEKIKILPSVNGRQCFSYDKIEHLSMKMLGIHQYENAAAAILAAEMFLYKYFKEKLSSSEKKNGIIRESLWQTVLLAVRNGIESAQWKGRMELVCENPFFLMDGAHNSCGTAALKNSLKQLYPNEKFHFIMGVMADKDYETMLEQLLPLAIDFKTVTVEADRALDAQKLADCIQKKGVSAVCCKNIEEALPDFSVDSTEKTIAFGSLYFIGEMKQFFQKNTNITK